MTVQMQSRGLDRSINTYTHLLAEIPVTELGPYCRGRKDKVWDVDCGCIRFPHNLRSVKRYVGLINASVSAFYPAVNFTAISVS